MKRTMKRLALAVGTIIVTETVKGYVAHKGRKNDQARQQWEEQREQARKQREEARREQKLAWEIARKERNRIFQQWQRKWEVYQEVKEIAWQICRNLVEEHQEPQKEQYFSIGAEMHEKLQEGTIEEHVEVIEEAIEQYRTWITDYLDNNRQK